jgi:hypothetical protein
MKAILPKLQRIGRHLLCLIRRPRNARFYLSGIAREIA